MLRRNTLNRVLELPPTSRIIFRSLNILSSFFCVFALPSVHQHDPVSLPRKDANVLKYGGTERNNLRRNATSSSRVDEKKSTMKKMLSKVRWPEILRALLVCDPASGYLQATRSLIHLSGSVSFFFSFGIRERICRVSENRGFTEDGQRSR